MRRRVTSFVPVLLGAYVPVAWAVQPHWGEGLIAHELGHGFLLVAMAILAVNALRRPHRGWRLMGWGACLFVVWTVITGVVHVLPTTAPGWLAVLRLDHLVLIPALACFWLGLGRLRRKEGR